MFVLTTLQHSPGHQQSRGQVQCPSLPCDACFLYTLDWAPGVWGLLPNKVTGAGVGLWYLANCALCKALAQTILKCQRKRWWESKNFRVACPQGPSSILRDCRGFCSGAAKRSQALNIRAVAWDDHNLGPAVSCSDSPAD